MLLVQYLNSQFSLAQNLDFISRIVVASLCGALIGAERSKRYKGAGIRTHVIVCCAASLMMIVSKYSFVDLTDATGTAFNGVRGADSARVAAQVVSGISFIGAGVIFKHGSAIRGLTTAAGLWATGGIGLAVGAGMYPLGIFTTIFIALVQVLMHKFLVVGGDLLLSNHLQFTICDVENFQETLNGYIHEHGIQIADSAITYDKDGSMKYDMVVRAPREITIHELDCFLRSCGELHYVSYTPIG